MKQNTKVMIIGAGPAGISAAIQLKRFGIDFLIIEKNNLGGLAEQAFLIENLPGFPKGITGKNYCSLLKNHLDRLDIKVIDDDILNCDFFKSQFLAQSQNNTYTSDYLLIATGTVPVIDDLFIFDDERKEFIFSDVNKVTKSRIKDVIIIGSGDCAFDYALNLADSKIKSSIFIRNSEAKAIKILIERTKNNPFIKVYYNFSVDKIELSADSKIQITFRNINDFGQIISGGLLLATGRKENLLFCSENLKNQFELLKEKSLLHFIGDIKNKINRQVSIAVGDGILSAMKINNLIKNESNR